MAKTKIGKKYNKILPAVIITYEEEKEKVHGSSHTALDFELSLDSLIMEMAIHNRKYCDSLRAKYPAPCGWSN